MIAKISTGSYTLGMVKYNHDKTNITKDGQKDAVVLGVNNIAGIEFNTIVSDIKTFNDRNKNVLKSNIHISLNFHKDDILSNEKIFEIAKDYLKELGYDDQPYAIYRHFDKEHPHVHIVSSQINLEGKKIDDSHIYYRSQKITRDLEEKYEITKAVEKNEIFSKQDIHTAIYEHLEHGKHSLLAIMKRVLSDVMDSKPTSDLQFEKLLEDYQMKRVLSYDDDQNLKGHFFDLYPLEYLNEEKEIFKKSKGIEGYEIDINFAYESIKTQIEQNSIEKESLKKQVMGRAYSIINPIVDNYKRDVFQQQIHIRYKKLSDFSLEMKKKGIEVIVKRSQTGEDPNSIYGLLFKDIKSAHTYSASDFKLKTKDFLKAINDDLKNIPEKEKKSFSDKMEGTEITVPNTFNKETEAKETQILGFLDTLMEFVQNSGTSASEDNSLPSKKRKRRRKR